MSILSSDKMKKVLGYDGGSFHLGHGHHEVVVPINCNPSRVHVWKSGSRDFGCRPHSINMIGWEVVEVAPTNDDSACSFGIEFTVHVKSENIEIGYFVLE